jgi:capsular exopolysaccharide synthesis family protein
MAHQDTHSLSGRPFITSSRDSREPEPPWQEDDLSWIRRGLHILSERRQLLVALLVLLSLPLIAYAFLVPAPRIFEARVLMLVEPEQVTMKDYAPTTEPADVEGSYYETQYRILRSRTLARQTLSNLEGNGTKASQQTTNAAEAVPTNDAIGDFLDALNVYQIPSSRLIELRFRSSDPEYAARAITAHTQTYVRQSVEFTLRASRETSDWLERQIDEQRTLVEKGESAVARYQQQYGAVEERQAAIPQRLSELNAAVLRARAERFAKESSYQQLKAASESGNPRAVSSLVGTGVIQQLAAELSALERRDLDLSAEYGERFPDRVKVRDAIAFTTGRLNAEVARTVEAAANDVSEAREKENRMVAALETETATASVLGRRAADFDTLKREVAADRALFEKLRDRARQLNIADDYQLSNIRVIDAAEVPDAPLPSNKVRNLVLGAGAAVMLATLIVLGVHITDERLRSSEDVKEHLGLPSLGMVPKLNGAGLSQYVFHEAMRDLRTQIMCGNGGEPSRALLVASADVAEGKTLVATNLAMNLAQIGRRVLLVDVDLRRPTVHEVLGVSITPGLAEVLSGATTADMSCRPTSQPNLWVLTAGRSQLHPGDLLSSSGFKRIMAGLVDAFDVVIIDSPPVLTATDAALLAHQNASTIFVVSADRTDRRVAQAAIERLESVGAKFVGVVLNRVDFRRNGSPYYNLRAHNYTYHDGRAVDEDPTEPSAPQTIERPA